MIKLKLNCSKIPKDKLFEGKNGKYIDLVLFENKSGPDQYGNDGFVAVDVTKDQREAGEKGEIVGNWKELGKPRTEGGQSSQRSRQPAQRSQPPPAQKRTTDPDLDVPEDDSDSVPF